MEDRVTIRFAREVGLEALESGIAPGALATSETLNRFRRTVEDAVQDVAERSRQYEEMVNRASSWLTSMTLWMYGQVTACWSSVNALSTGSKPVDMFSSTNWTLSGNMLDTTFGQITPPISQRTETTNHRKKVYVSVGSSASLYHVDGGDMELDMTQMHQSGDWQVPLVIPDGRQPYLWLYLPLQQTSLLSNNVSVAVLPPGSVYIRRVSVLSGNRWHSVYNGTNANIFSGRFWWDVRNTGNARAVGIQLYRTSLSLPVALVHLAAYATRFEEAGTATFNAQAAFGGSFTIRSFTVYPIFPTNPSYSANVSGSSNHLFNLTVRRITPYVPTVIGGAVLKKPVGTG